MMSQGARLRRKRNCAFMPWLGKASTSGTHRWIIYRVRSPRAMQLAKGTRQLNVWLRNVPRGTPSKLATGMPAHIIATALVPLPSRAIFTATIVAVPK